MEVQWAIGPLARTEEGETPRAPPPPIRNRAAARLRARSLPYNPRKSEPNRPVRPTKRPDGSKAARPMLARLRPYSRATDTAAPRSAAAAQSRPTAATRSAAARTRRPTLRRRGRAATARRHATTAFPSASPVPRASAIATRTARHDAPSRTHRSRHRAAARSAEAVAAVHHKILIHFPTARLAPRGRRPRQWGPGE